MKILLLITTLFYTQVVHADQQLAELPQTIDVTIESNSTPEKCKLSEVKDVYLCNSANGYYIFLNENPYKLIDISTPNHIRYASIKKVADKNNVIFQDTLPEEIISLLDASTKVIRKDTKDNAKDNFFTLRDIKNDFEKIKKISDPKIKNAVNELQTQYANAEKNYNNVLNSDKIVLSLKDNSQQDCKRMPAANESSHCNVFECANPKDKNEKNLIIYDPEYFPSVLPVLQTIKNGQLVPSKDVIKITNPKSKMLLADVAAITEDTQDPYNYRVKEAEKILKTSMPNMAKNYAYLKDYFIIEYRDNQMFSCLQTPLIKQFDKASDDLFTKVSNLPLEILVRIIDDNVIVANYTDKNLAKENSCKVNGVYVAKDSLDSIDYLDSALTNVQKSPKDFIDLNKAYELFDKARAMNEIAWNYKADGCYARAHLMAREFEKEGIHVDKAWLKGDLGLPEENIQWNYHVAPLVYVKDANGKVTPTIIDPSVFPAPVPLEAWVKKISPYSYPKIEKTSFPFPVNVELAHRTVLSISSSNPYTPMESITNTEEKKMQLALDTMIEYKELSENPEASY